MEDSYGDVVMINLLSLKIRVRNLYAKSLAVMLFNIVIISRFDWLAMIVLCILISIVTALLKRDLYEKHLPKEDPCSLEELGMSEDDLEIHAWEKYPGYYDKHFAQIITKSGDFISHWNWPNAEMVGDVKEKDMAFIRYAKWRDL